jgi:dihydrolipoamide dehydrogenase
MNATEHYDLIIIGAGPAGYVAAIRAAQLGFSVACCDSRPSFGGTCLNVGCIPSKALLESSAFYHRIQEESEIHGIKAKASFNFKDIRDRKNSIVQKLQKGIAFLFSQQGIKGFHAQASLKDKNTVSLKHPDGKTSEIQAKKAIIIATGSSPSPLPGISIDESMIVSSTGALDFQEVPEHLVVVGGGVIGLEIGSVYRRLGAKVSVIEYLNTLTPGMDKELTKAFHKSLTKQGFSFHFRTKVTQAKIQKKSVIIEAVNADDDSKSSSFTADKLLIAIGRRPATENLDTKNVGITTDAHGFIPVDDHFQTSCHGIYAIGDCIGGAMLAHKAEEEAIALVESLAGQKGHVDYLSIPSIIYTEPEVASVGNTEEQLKEQKIAYKAGKASFAANGRAMAMNETDGFVKILACADTDTILGAHIIGPQAGNLIHEVTAVMAYRGSSEDLARTNHAHPTLNETVKEAAKKIHNMSISS